MPDPMEFFAARERAIREHRLDGIRAATGNKRLKNRGKIVAEVLKALNDGQGHASILCQWDGIMDHDGAEFEITVYRERDGLTFAEKGRMTQADFEEAINKLTET